MVNRNGRRSGGTTNGKLWSVPQNKVTIERAQQFLERGTSSQE
jgi:hypothetical protein